MFSASRAFCGLGWPLMDRCGPDGPWLSACRHRKSVTWAHLCRAFFGNFGTVLEAFVSYDRHTGRPRGFGFVVFDDPAVADKVVSLQHTIDRREVRKPYHTTQQ